MERIPPHNLEAERSTIGACMLSKEALMDVSEEVRADDKDMEFTMLLTDSFCLMIGSIKAFICFSVLHLLKALICFAI